LLQQKATTKLPIKIFTVLLCNVLPTSKGNMMPDLQEERLAFDILAKNINFFYTGSFNEQLALV
jgi:hypothetical protein